MGKEKKRGEARLLQQPGGEEKKGVIVDRDRRAARFFLHKSLGREEEWQELEIETRRTGEARRRDEMGAVQLGVRNE